MSWSSLPHVVSFMTCLAAVLHGTPGSVDDDDRLLVWLHAASHARRAAGG